MKHQVPQAIIKTYLVEIIVFCPIYNPQQDFVIDELLIFWLSCFSCTAMLLSGVLSALFSTAALNIALAIISFASLLEHLKAISLK